MWKTLVMRTSHVEAVWYVFFYALRAWNYVLWAPVPEYKVCYYTVRGFRDRNIPGKPIEVVICRPQIDNIIIIMSYFW